MLLVRHADAVLVKLEARAAPRLPIRNRGHIALLRGATRANLDGSPIKTPDNSVGEPGVDLDRPARRHAPKGGGAWIPIRPYGDDDELGPSLDDRKTRLSHLGLGEQFLYTFDLGDDWTHLCTVGPERIDPDGELGIVPDGPLAYWGWGTIPDQYGRGWDGDDGAHRTPRDPRGADLPPLRAGWGPEGRS